MKVRRIGLVLVIILIFILCYRHMNENFDVLSRYPYQNEESRELIKQYLDDEEIEYIIEFDIAPVYFIEYISFDDFSVLHINEYNYVKDLDLGLSDEEIVAYVEYFFSYDIYDSVISWLRYYDFDTILAWMENGDVYDSEAVIEIDPSSYNALLEEHVTILNWSPSDLVTGDINEQEVTLRVSAYTSLLAMIDALESDIEEAEITITTSYISYEDLVIIEADCSGDFPGHSEHQLGLAFDFEADEEVLAWLYENSENYGFYFTKDEMHLRYRGEDDWDM